LPVAEGKVAFPGISLDTICFLFYHKSERVHFYDRGRNRERPKSNDPASTRRKRTTMHFKREESWGFFAPSLRLCLRYPGRLLQAFDQAQATQAHVPYQLWSKLTTIAVGGSLLYGASLSLLFRRWRPGRSALWLALSAGGAWCLFGPFLVLLSHLRTLTCVQACLTTMAYGEGVLVSGAGINLWFRLKGGFEEAFLTRWNVALVGFSNIVMGTALVRQLHALNVPAWKTVLSWIAVLNGSGVLLFALFRRLLQGGR
jgi:uncharacterized membrane protein YhaH (DUF805 family)